MAKTNRAAEKRARIERVASDLAIVHAGKCPRCGTSLRRNLAFFFWYQCGAYAAESHRLPEHRGLPSCSWQVIVDREDVEAANALVTSREAR